MAASMSFGNVSCFAPRLKNRPCRQGSSDLRPFHKILCNCRELDSQQRRREWCVTCAQTASSGQQPKAQTGSLILLVGQKYSELAHFQVFSRNCALSAARYFLHRSMFLRPSRRAISTFINATPTVAVVGATGAVGKVCPRHHSSQAAPLAASRLIDFLVISDVVRRMPSAQFFS